MKNTKSQTGKQTKTTKKIYFTKKRKAKLMKLKFFTLSAFLSLSFLAIYGATAQTNADISSISQTTIKHQKKPSQSQKQTKEMTPKEYILNEWDKIGKKEEANRIIECESHFNPDAININTNKTADLGYYQFNTIHVKSGFISLACISDYKCATQKAIELYKKQGFRPWVCAKIHNIK